MKMMMSALVLVALLGIGSGLMRSGLHFTHSTTTGLATSKPQPPQAVGSAKLPVQDFDDRSLVFPRETKP
ncbi:putative membrane protein [Bradyrhizobium sp. RT9b]|uniref:hypothetical protein n=1 Tax=unclassified Bradyrhizobium TaxID=2631580 RepID=UPI0007C1919B|nr:hypothetical protein [Bradyrhizobium sp.]CUU15682.1 hypothetical protein CDS [Bradyrhizobium sp.]